jgi:Ca2+-binding RTX toxin-like protein
MVVENVTTGASFTQEHDVTGLSLDVGDNDDENFTFGAREVNDGEYDQFFKGDINYVAIFDQDVVSTGDGIVSGTTGDDLIDLAYTGDPHGDMVDNNDAILPGEAPNDDIIHAGAGDDTIFGGEGDDEIYGDTGTSNVEMERESFNWNKIPDTNGGGGSVDDEESLNNQTLTQDTGNVTVTVTTPTVTSSGHSWYHHSDDSIGVESSFESEDVVISGIDGAGSAVNDNSSLASLAEEGESGTYNIEFSDTVENVDFRISDIDANRGQVTIRAYDAAGNAIDVDLTAGSNLTLTNTDSVAGADTATSANTHDVSPTATSNSVLVQIAGPVARIEVIHTNVGSGLSGINISDIYYDAPTGVVVDGAGNDLINGGVGADAIFGEGGDDTIQLTDAFGDDTIVGGETGETNGDTLDATGVTTDTSVTFTDPETGTISSGADDANFAEIENVLLGSGDDTVTGSNGDDAVDLGQGEDVADMGKGDDTVGLGKDSDGTPDGDKDVVIFSDGDGDDTILDFDAPITNPDGTLTGIDTLDVSGLNDADGNPVNVADVTTTENPDGDAVLTFPNGESLTLVGIPASAVTTPEQLIAIGIPGLPLDGIVDGTSGDDLIDLAYTGDPQGDMIDAGDAILPGEAPNDDIVEAGAGNDTVFAGLGDDEVWGRDGDDDLYGEEGDDYLSGGEGDDLLVGGAGNDTLDAGQGVDTLYGGEGDDLLLGGPTTDFLDGGTGNDTLNGGNNADTIYGGDGNDVANGEFGDDYIDVSGTNPILDNPPVPGLPADATPNDDRDYVDGGEGNDTILTGDDADTIYGGAGNDSIDAGIDDDYIDGGDGDDTIDGSIGNDTIYGGAGNDSIIAGIDAASDYVGDDPHFPLGDPNKNDGRDFVDAGAGDDYVFTGDDSDTIYGGTGNDTIHAGIDDDFIYGGDGNDEITGGHGSDYIEGGDGDDVINAGDSTLLYGQAPDATDPVPTNGRDTVDGGAGNDYIEGQDDNDLLMGGTGNDTIDGGIDNDTILGGEGDDLIIGGEGADDLQGGTGDDYFDGATAGDVVLGGEDADGNDIDTLDLRGSGAIRITYDPADSEAGTVEFLDGVGGPVTGTMTFSEIENVIPCFTPGTSIATPKGERLVEELKVGDKVITRDNGIQEIRWLGAKDMDWKQLALNPHLKPILVRAGSLGNGLPERDMMVSPNHRLLVANDKTALYFEENEVLAAAKHLVNNRGIHEVETMGTQYIHFMFDNHEVVLSNGAWTESFQPGDYTLEGIGNAQRNEILELFPELKTAQGIEAYQSARRTLKKHEARLLVD